MYSLASLIRRANPLFNRISINVRQKGQLIENSLSPGLGFPASRGREGGKEDAYAVGGMGTSWHSANRQGRHSCTTRWRMM